MKILMNYSTHYQYSEGSPSSYPPHRKLLRTRRSPFRKHSQAFESLTNIDTHHEYIHPNSNNPTFPPNPKLNVESSSSPRYAPSSSPYSLPFSTPSRRRPNRYTGMRLLTQLDFQRESDCGTPSSESSSSSQMVITPSSSHGGDQPVENGEDGGISMDVEFDGECCKYVTPHGSPPRMAAVEPELASNCPRRSATAAWEFDEAQLRAGIQPSSDYVSAIQNAHFPHECQHRTHPYPQDLNYTPAAFTAAFPHSSSSIVSPPASISSNLWPRSSMFLPPLSSTASRFMCQTIPLHQPQPIRPIPIIPLSDISSSFSEDLSMSSHRSSPYLPQAHGGSAHTDAHLPEIGPEASDSHNTIDFLSPFSLLCQPVSDVVRYQLKPAIDARRHRNNTSSTSASGGLDEHYYNNGLPKILGGLFCACGCLGLKHLQSDAGGSHL